MTIKALRDLNRKTILSFLERTAIVWDQQVIDDFFSGDSTFETVIEQGDSPIYRSLPVKTWFLKQSIGLNLLKYQNNVLFEGDDPERFMIKTTAFPSKQADERFAAQPVYLILDFLMSQGRIVRFRQTPNPCEQLHQSP